MLADKLFQNKGSADRNARSPNVVLVGRVGSVSLSIFEAADQGVAHQRSVTLAGTHQFTFFSLALYHLPPCTVELYAFWASQLVKSVSEK